MKRYKYVGYLKEKGHYLYLCFRCGRYFKVRNGGELHLHQCSVNSDDIDFVII